MLHNQQTALPTTEKIHIPHCKKTKTYTETQKQNPQHHNNNPHHCNYPPIYIVRMQPNNKTTAHHPAHPILEEYAINGCPVDCGKPWSQAHLEAAIMHGNHPSANTPDAQKHLRAEAHEKVDQGTANIIKLSDIQHNHHQNLKILPLAAVPHKSHSIWAILDLSFQLHVNSKKFPSINMETILLAHQKSMEQMGHVLP